MPRYDQLPDPVSTETIPPGLFNWKHQSRTIRENIKNKQCDRTTNLIKQANLQQMKKRVHKDVQCSSKRKYQNKEYEKVFSPLLHFISCVPQFWVDGFC